MNEQKQLLIELLELLKEEKEMPELNPSPADFFFDVEENEVEVTNAIRK